MIVWVLSVWLVAVNLWAYAAFGNDKRRAVRGEWRLPESHLLLLAVLGGWVGAKVGQRRFRHKTRKEPFRTALNAALIGPLAVVAALLSPLGAALERGISGTWRGVWDAALTGTPPTVEKRLPHRFGPGSGD